MNWHNDLIRRAAETLPTKQHGTELPSAAPALAGGLPMGSAPPDPLAAGRALALAVHRGGAKSTPPNLQEAARPESHPKRSLRARRWFAGLGGGPRPPAIGAAAPWHERSRRKPTRSLQHARAIASYPMLRRIVLPMLCDVALCRLLRITPPKLHKVVSGLSSFQTWGLK